MTYQILRADSLEGLQEIVNAHMAGGWIPKGGVVVETHSFAAYGDARSMPHHCVSSTYTGLKNWYLQAVAKL